MIYIYMSSLLEVQLKNKLSSILCDYDFIISSEKSSKLSYDIYFIEITNICDIKKIGEIDQTYNPLIYVIGTRDYDLISMSVSKNINMYFDRNNLINDFMDKIEDIKSQVNKKFKCYLIKTKYAKVSLRINQIIYVESMNHEIIIHSITGEIIQRKSLLQFLKEINSSNFIQIHKSYVINSAFILQIKNKQMILKNNHIIPIGKKYGQQLINL